MASRPWLTLLHLLMEFFSFLTLPKPHRFALVCPSFLSLATNSIYWVPSIGKALSNAISFNHHNRRCKYYLILQVKKFSSVQSLSRVRLFATPWTAARQASLSITNYLSLPKLMSIELVIPSTHLILCRPLLLLSSIFPSIRVFSNESAHHIRWPKY